MALVLTRLPGESVYIDTADGRITITQLDDNRLAFAAPVSVNIVRAEVESNKTKQQLRQEWRDGGRR